MTGSHRFADAPLGRAFHDTALSAGAMPIDVLAGLIERWTATQMA